MPMNSPHPLPATAEGQLCLALLQVITETRHQLGLDPDGSLTLDRVLAALGGFDQVSRAMEPMDTRATAEVRACNCAVRDKLRRAGPLLSRLALAATKD